MRNQDGLPEECDGLTTQRLIAHTEMRPFILSCARAFLKSHPDVSVPELMNTYQLTILFMLEKSKRVKESDQEATQQIEWVEVAALELIAQISRELSRAR